MKLPTNPQSGYSWWHSTKVGNVRLHPELQQKPSSLQKELQDLAFHSDEANALWSETSNLPFKPQLRRRDGKKRIACLKCEPAFNHSSLEKPTNCGHYLRKVWDGL